MPLIESFYEAKEELTKKNEAFTVSASGSSLSIKHGGQTRMFYADDEQEVCLPLISKVQADAKKFLKRRSLPDIAEKDISWCKLFPDRFGALMDDDFQRITVAKCDIRAAYWRFALLNGVISRETNEYLTNKYAPKELADRMHFLVETGQEPNEQIKKRFLDRQSKIVERAVKKYKQARLLALGTLASLRSFQCYVPGPDGRSVQDFDLSKSKKDEYASKKTDLRNLYFWICSGVDNLMKDLSEKSDAVYYYWDCSFVVAPNGKKNEGVQSFGKLVKKLGFDYSVEYGHIQQVSIQDNYFEFVSDRGVSKNYPLFLDRDGNKKA